MQNSLFRGPSQSKAWKTVGRIIKADSTEAVSFSLWHRGFDHLRWRCMEETCAENRPVPQQTAPHPRILPFSILMICITDKVLFILIAVILSKLFLTNVSTSSVKSVCAFFLSQLLTTVIADAIPSLTFHLQAVSFWIGEISLNAKKNSLPPK